MRRSLRAAHAVRPAWFALLALAIATGCGTLARPIAEAERAARAERDLARLFPDATRAPERLDLWTAMARAVRLNLDRRVALLDEALASRRLGAARVDLLPQLVAETEYYGRNNQHGAVSESLLTGNTSLEPSTSQERYGWRSNLTLAWSLLDFGVSWVRAAQEADRARIAAERRARATQDLLLDVRIAFYRAAGAQRLLRDVGALDAQVAKALSETEALERERLLEPMAALEYRRALLDRMRELRELRAALEGAQIELARLTHVRPGTPLELDVPEADLVALPAVDFPLAELERVALRLRPELREEDHRTRVQRLEVRRAMLAMLPGVELRVSRHEDSNEFLFNEDWWSTSALLTKNLMELVNGASELRVARAGQDVAETRRLALSMAVLAQVNLAWQELATARAGFATASELLAVEARLHHVTRELVGVKRISELELVRRDADRKTAELRHWLAFADLQQGYGRLLHAVGASVEVGDEASLGVDALAIQLRRGFDDFRRRIEIARDYPDADFALRSDGER